MIVCAANLDWSCTQFLEVATSRAYDSLFILCAFQKQTFSVSGLDKSGGSFSTQCEAEGFRGITYFLDRPDVMPIWTVRVVRNDTCQVLLRFLTAKDQVKKYINN